MPITKAYIQEKGGGKLRHEEGLVVTELMKRKIPYELYTEKKIRRRSLLLDSDSLVVGDMDCIYGALKQLDIEIPNANTYPKSLRRFMYREVSESTIGELESLLITGNANPLFAKPASRQKVFTGRVFETEQDLYYIYGISRKQKIYCADIVKFVSEYRVYVVNSEIRAIDFYEGDRNIPLDKEIVKKSILALDEAGESYRGYAIDFGVLESGETALIEMNDGFAVGAYEIDAKNYTDMIISRWEELLC